LVIKWGKETEAVRGITLSGADNTSENMISIVTTLPVSVSVYYEGACSNITQECHSTAHWGATQCPYWESNPVSPFMDTYWGKMAGVGKVSSY